MDFFQFFTPLGSMALAADEEKNAITRLYLPNSPTPRLMSRQTPLLDRGRTQLLESLSGLRRELCDAMNTAATAALEGSWAEADKAAGAGHRLWEQRRKFVASVVDHQLLEEADTLYGVTMPQPGISKVTTVDLKTGRDEILK